MARQYESRQEKISHAIRLIFSFAMAVLIYFAVTLSAREKRAITIPLVVIPNSTFVNNSNIQDSINIEILGNPSIIYNINPDKITAYLDCSKIQEEGIYNLDVNLKYDLGIIEGTRVEIVNNDPVIRASFVSR